MKNLWQKCAAAGLLAAITIILSPQLSARAAYAYELLVYNLAPTSERALYYGQKHFDSLRGSHDYDIDAAEYFFTRAVAIEPVHPAAYHELSRVAFLRGNLLTALALINIQIGRFEKDVPNAYYVRALIEGYLGRYDEAALDYEHYISLQEAPGWAAYNDLAWVLLKANRPRDAARAAARGIAAHPQNPWLYNSFAIALYESGEREAALAAAETALYFADVVTDEMWLRAYPGNDPRVSASGADDFRAVLGQNMHTIDAETARSLIQ
ncbi:MAG TPA: hypothetical protein VJB97_01670 [Candidatus Paceibacterota bacterium]